MQPKIHVEFSISEAGANGEQLNEEEKEIRATSHLSTSKDADSLMKELDYIKSQRDELQNDYSHSQTQCEFYEGQVSLKEEQIA